MSGDRRGDALRSGVGEPPALDANGIIREGYVVMPAFAVIPPL